MNLKINLDENIYLVQNIAFLMVKIIDKKIANKNDNGSLRWTIPQVLKFKNGKLISSATGMMYELQNNQTKYDELSENQKNNIYSIYYIVLSKNEGEVD